MERPSPSNRGIADRCRHAYSHSSLRRRRTSMLALELASAALTLVGPPQASGLVCALGGPPVEARWSGPIPARPRGP